MPSENSAPIIQKIQPAQTDEETLARMLQQSIAEARAAKALAESRLAEIQALKAITEADQLLAARYKMIIKDQDELITRKQKQLDDLKCTKITFLFHLITFKRCG